MTETKVAPERDDRAVTRPVVLLAGYDNALELAEIRGACKAFGLQVRVAATRPTHDDVAAALRHLDPAIPAVMVVVPEAEGGLEAINLAHAMVPELPIIAHTGRGRGGDGELRRRGVTQVIGRDLLHELLAEVCAVLDVPGPPE